MSNKHLILSSTRFKSRLESARILGCSKICIVWYLHTSLVLTHLFWKNKICKLFLTQEKRFKKKKKEKKSTEQLQNCTPTIATCEAIFDKEAEVYMKRLVTILSKKWQSNYSRVVCYIRARMQICIHRSVSLCIRGSRSK